MTIVWSLPVRGERLTSSRGDLVRARSLIEALRSDGHEVIVVADATERESQAAVFAYRTVLRALLPRAAALVLRDLGRIVHGILHGLRVAAAARRTRADLIIETQVAYAVSGALAGRLTRVPVVLDDCSPVAEERALGAGLPGLARAILSVQGRCARAVVAVSPTVADMLAGEGLSREKLVRVPNGIDVKSFELADGTRWRSEYGLHDQCVVGFVGSFQPWHRVDLLIEAVALLPAGSPLHVVLAGAGPGLETVLQGAARRGLTSVTAVGPVAPEAVPSLLMAFDIGVLPHSNAYGDPMKLREYAAAGLPSVAPDLEPVRELIEHDATGLLFPLGDVRKLTESLWTLLGDRALRRRLGEEARKRALISSSWIDRSRTLVAAAVRDSRTPAHQAAPARRAPEPGAAPEACRRGTA